MNSMKTTMLLALMIALFVALGGAIGGRGGMMLGLAIGLITNFTAYWFSDKLVLAMSGAQPVTESQAPELYRTVRNLAQRARMPMPKIYIIPERAPNAFATGRSPDHAAIAVTAGLLELLDRGELEGVLSHELSHILNRDTLVSTVAASIAGAISFLAHMAYFIPIHSNRDDDGPNPIASLLMVMFAPLAAMLIQMAISRSREYGADATGARLTADPEKLARALEKLEQGSKLIPMHHANPETAHLFIVSPLSGRQIGEGIASLFSTHPPLADRVRRLREMRPGYGPA